MREYNNIRLTSREKDIVKLLLEGKNKQEIANKIGISVSTIKTNVEHLYQKFGVHNKVELVVYIIKNNILEI